MADAVGFMQYTEFADILFSGAEPDAAVNGWRAIEAVLEQHTTTDGVFLDGAAWLVSARV